MNTMSNRHLTEDQIDDILIGDLAPETTAHLKQCTTCQTRLEAAKAPIASFTAVSMAWSERRSATVPVTLVHATSSAGRRQAHWAAAATAALAIALSVPLTMHQKQSPVVASDVTVPQSAKAVVAQVTPTATAGQTVQARVQPVTSARRGSDDAEIAHDNEMLQAIHRELDASVQPASDPFGLLAVGGTSAAHGRYAPVQTWD